MIAWCNNHRCPITRLAHAHNAPTITRPHGVLEALNDITQTSVTLCNKLNENHLQSLKSHMSEHSDRKHVRMNPVAVGMEMYFLASIRCGNDDSSSGNEMYSSDWLSCPTVRAVIRDALQTSAERGLRTASVCSRNAHSCALYQCLLCC